MAEEDIYCTLLLNDNYLPGAQILAHSLRDHGTTKKLAVMTVLDLRPETVEELQRLYDYIIPVERIHGQAPENLRLLGRPELCDTFTKIHLWNQTQFRKIVYIDADVLVLRAPDELFDLDVRFAASPDIGWPDCFNSGVFLLKPDPAIYEELLAQVERGETFDGADQGLLNIFFSDWHRLSFVYNCTPSASYQYIPAYKHYQSKLSMVHFIGANKPWSRGRSQAGSESTPYDQLLGQWWAVWDKHYTFVHSTTRSSYNINLPAGKIGSVARSTKAPYASGIDAQAYNGAQYNHSIGAAYEESINRIPYGEHRPMYHSPIYHQVRVVPGAEVRAMIYTRADYIPVTPTHYRLPQSMPPAGDTRYSLTQSHIDETESRTVFTLAGASYVSKPSGKERENNRDSTSPPSVAYPDGYVPPFVPPNQLWDPSSSAPPTNSAPEAANLPHKTYVNEWDRDKTKHNHYLSGTVTPTQGQHSGSAFPWEARSKTPTRVFNKSGEEIQTPENERSEPEFYRSGDDTAESEEEPISDHEYAETEDAMSWRDYVHGNQWDAIPGISKYVSALKKRHSLDKTDKRRSQGIVHSSINSNSEDEEDHPSLPVTPNPLRRSGYWVTPTTPVNEDQFPSAPGIPPPEKWDPHAKLNELRTIPKSFLASQKNKSPPAGLSPAHSPPGQGQVLVQGDVRGIRGRGTS